MDELEELKKVLNLTSTRVRNNVKIVSDKDLGYNYVHHIAKTRMRHLVPNISKRAAPSEDNTLPRIHVGPTLKSCILGYAAIVHDTSNLIPNKTVDNDSWLGGYYVYTIPFKYMLKPNTKLVYDSDYSNEHWLITYNKDTVVYKPLAVDKMIFTGLTLEPIATKKNVLTISLAIDVQSDTGIRLDDERYLTKGCYRFNYIEEYNFGDGENKYTDIFSDPVSISKAEFMELRNLRATMLSVGKPSSFLNKW